MAGQVSHIHPPTYPNHINASYILCRESHRRNACQDPGATVSVVRYDFLPNKYGENLSESSGVVGANGMAIARC